MTHPRHVFLSGPMGAGKSTVGPLLASAIGATFVDLDTSLERETGMRIAEIFRSRGEATFRRLEADVVRRLVAHERRGVFALGGGTVEDPETRAFLLDRGVLVTLSAPLASLVSRTTSDPRSPTSRPLLAGDAPSAALARILERRADAYAEAHRVIDTSEGGPEEIAARIARWLPLDERSICVQLGRRSHRVVIARGALASLGDELAALEPSRLVIVTDANVRAEAARWLSSTTTPMTWVELAPGEANKSIASIERIWDAAIEAHVDRRAVVVAVGGGVVGDLAGFAAATLLRGVRVVQVPTSLLAMVDSSVGGKTAIDRAQGKNLVGAFHQPSLVVCDVDALASLPGRELRAGMAEIVKTAWIEGEGDVAALERDAERLLADDDEGRAARERAIHRAVRTKARIVASDETEQGARRLLNFGHTLGHAVEAASGYALVHGEAIAIGLVAALRLSVQLGHAEPAHVARMTALLERLGLPVAWPGHGAEALARYLAVDKKSEGEQLRFVVAGAPGRVRGVVVRRAQVLALVDALARG
ncbi:MAG: 3-dehydroquinate synthase [Sandaracinaceae bacterium]|nr:3-dehydroquinate synthase [Sandaracinaceae bacterium]